MIDIPLETLILEIHRIFIHISKNRASFHDNKCFWHNRQHEVSGKHGKFQA